MTSNTSVSLAEQVAWVAKNLAVYEPILASANAGSPLHLQAEREVGMYHAILASLRSLEAALLNARRYEWLRSGVSDDLTVADLSGAHHWEEAITIDGEELDAVIDSAMEQPK